MVAELPAGQDPDDYIRHSPEAWPAFVESALPLLDYLLDSLSARSDMVNLDEKARVISVLLRFVARISDPMTRDLHLEQLAGRLGVSVEWLHANMTVPVRDSEETQKRRQSRPPAIADDAAPPPLRDESAIEESLLALLLQHGSQLGSEAADAVAAEWFSRSENREVYRSVFAYGTLAASEPTGVAPELEPHLNLLRSRELMLSSRPNWKRLGSRPACNWKKNT